MYKIGLFLFVKSVLGGFKTADCVFVVVVYVRIVWISQQRIREWDFDAVNKLQ